MTQIRIFLSTVSAEFRSYRDALRHDLERPNVTVKVQEDFIVTGTETLDMLDDYIRQCDAVIHLVGDMTGALAQAPSLAFILDCYPDIAERLPPLCPFLKPGGQALSYTQWEAWLALYHRKVLIIAVPEEGAPRDVRYESIDEQRAQQQQHLARLADIERYPGIRFASADRLAVEILRSKVHDILTRAGPAKKPVNLPIASIGDLFKGRGTLLDDLSQSLGPVSDVENTSVVARVLNGLGGVGKTRVALEYAWRHAEDYTALLFVGADSAEALQHNLAVLCRSLELNEQWEADERRQRDAVLKWLKQNPGWLLILDNVDTEEAATAVELLMPELFGGHVLVTSRLLNWSSGLMVLPVGILSTDTAIEFLLERTATKRRRMIEDNIQARILAEELGCLALALEQAGAYICVNRLTLKDYLVKWHSQRDSVLAWYDPRIMQYPKSVAVTWKTTCDQLGDSARQLLQRLAWVSSAQIPESLLEVPMADGENVAGQFTALTELESYSLVTRVTDSPSFSVHRLVQDVTRRQHEDSERLRLNEALQWIDTAFAGNPQDVRTWLVLNPLQPHVQAVVEHADAAGITAPTARLMNQLGLLYLNKSLHTEAEPLMRRALAIEEASFGPDHPNVARDLNNLALLLQATNRLNEAEPLMRRALIIFIKSVGMEHPHSCIVMDNYNELLRELGRTENEIKANLGNLFD